jgi:hypothetical protein
MLAAQSRPFDLPEGFENSGNEMEGESVKMFANQRNFILETVFLQSGPGLTQDDGSP